MAYDAREGFEAERQKQPTSYSTGPTGLAAMYRLYSRLGDGRFKAVQFQRPITHLPADAALLVVSHPFRRNPSPEEKASLRKWISGGGALLLLLDESAALTPLGDLLEDKLSVTLENPAPVDMKPHQKNSPYP